MDNPTNHFTQRTDGRQSQGHKPGYAPSWSALLAAIAAWCLIVCGLTYMGLPFVRFLMDHISRVQP